MLGPETVSGRLSFAIPWLNGYMGKRIIFTGFWWGNLRKRDHLEDAGVDGRVIVSWIFRKWDVGHGLDRCGLGQGQVAGTCECGNEPSGSIKCGKILD